MQIYIHVCKYIYIYANIDIYANIYTYMRIKSHFYLHIPKLTCLCGHLKSKEVLCFFLTH